MFENIPAELKNYNQWILWRLEDRNSKKPTKIPYSIDGNLANVSNSETWSSFEKTINVLNSNNWYSGIGFVLTNEDPFSFIDLDDCGDDKLNFQRQIEIYNTFESYSEKSPSGKGLHIIIKGQVQSGRRRDKIEVYSSQRYMTMTGDVFRNTPIKDCQKELDILWAQLQKSSNVSNFYAGLSECQYSDIEILEKCKTAENGNKFKDLFDGNWNNYYQSQSEADLAIINIIAFYTQNKAQITRIFKLSELGKREKANRIDYINWMLNKSFDRILPPIDISQITLNIEKKLKETSAHNTKTDFQKQKPNENTPLEKPDGVLGDIVQFIYDSAPRPVFEIALAGAIGYMAGIIGRSYNVSGTGLNQYILLLAETGTGKEHINQGIEKLQNLVIKMVPAAADFIGPAKISSQEALIKYMSKNNSFVSFSGEFGLTMQQMAMTNASPHLLGLKKLMLELYNKSGEGCFLRSSISADRDKNIKSIDAPSFSILAESNPQRYYKSLDEDMISDGLLPRFTTIEYYGDRPPLNKNHMSVKPSFELIDKLSSLCAHSLMLNNQNKTIQIKIDSEAELELDVFDKFCDNQINKSNKDCIKHLWNRAHLKAMKIASLIAVGKNPYDPEIKLKDVLWALNLVKKDAHNLTTRFNSGDVGKATDESHQLVSLKKVIVDYYTKLKEETSKSYKLDKKMVKDKIIPYKYLQIRCSNLAVFSKDKMGATFSLKRTLQIMCDNGDLRELSKVESIKNYNSETKCYALLNFELLN